MKNADSPVSPCEIEKSNPVVGVYTVSYSGLTKRELIAAMAMQGFWAAGTKADHVSVAMHSVKSADALLEALEEDK